MLWNPDDLKSFLDRHTKDENAKIVVITSGGTAVPLEKNCVRYIENFSNGTRGAISAEKFLENGYLVIFFHRANSLQPYSHRFPDLFNHLKPAGENKFTVSDYPHLGEMIERKHKYADRILLLPFNSFDDYKNDLEYICHACAGYKKRLCVYLAAAVSDFYIDAERLPEHKIQSADGGLNLKLTIAPKVLRRIVKDFVPEAFVVSFKLETDPSVLVEKSKKAIKEYGHQIVIANMLKTRKRRVTFIRANEDPFPIDLDSPEFAEKADVEIEELIIERLKKLHSNYCHV
uniref:DNA/pantothenate metabolism flavoprotein C-terminal domain-containing protein n=1 Tax=Panagrolaimus davidi TaxID=227884 RepID=A0A914P9Z3_9BILA